jgi:hypothetical protein
MSVSMIFFKVNNMKYWHKVLIFLYYVLFYVLSHILFASIAFLYQVYPVSYIYLVSCISKLFSPFHKCWLKLVSGTYAFQANRANSNQNKVDATCLLCNAEDEDIEHFLLRCSVLDEIRNIKILQFLKSKTTATGMHYQGVGCPIVCLP